VTQQTAHLLLLPLAKFLNQRISPQEERLLEELSLGHITTLFLNNYPSLPKAQLPRPREEVTAVLGRFTAKTLT